jgi:hypothetical protein
LQRLEAIRALGGGDLPLTPIPPNRLRAVARYGAAARAQAIAQLAPERRLATRRAFAPAFAVIALDEALERLDRVMTES